MSSALFHAAFRVVQLWVAAVLFLSLPLFAAEELLFVDTSGKVFRFDGITWKETNPDSLDAPEFARVSGTILSGGGEVSLDPQGKIRFQNAQGQWQGSVLLPPPSPITYESAHTDSLGNQYVKLGGTGQGFNYVGKNGQPVIVASKMQWENNIVPEITQIVGSPWHETAYAITKQGEVIQIEPPHVAMGKFRFHPVMPGANAVSLKLSPAGIVIGREGGGYSLLTKRSLVDLPLPGVGKLVSSYEAQAGNTIRSLLPASRAIPPRVAPPAVAEPPVAEGRAASSGNVSLDTLADEVAKRRAKVEEFRFIAEEAKRLGVRAWLFGGTAAGYAHYVNWDLAREHGDRRYQPDRFDYDYTNIFRSTQDLDIVIDGNSQQAQELAAKLAEKFPHFQGSKDAWEVRLLRSQIGDKEAILDNPNFMNQHTDSNSTGMIELTDTPKGEPVVRDVRDWSEKKPFFLRDVYDRKLHFYFSDLHHTTARAREGLNPPIEAAIRYFTKAFQYELSMRPEDLRNVKRIIDSFDPKSVEPGSQVANWIKKNGKKLIQNAVNIEFAVETLKGMGLTQKLIEIGGRKDEVDSLAWWMSKEPLRAKSVGQGNGRTAKEIFDQFDLYDEDGKMVLAHETNNFLAYESITKAHTGEPNVLISREVGGMGEMAAHGDGFYMKAGRLGARNTGYTVRTFLDPAAREGTDFLFVPEAKFFVIQNKSAIRVIPESLNLTLPQLFSILAADDRMLSSDRGQIEKMKRKLLTKQSLVKREELEEAVDILLAIPDKAKQELLLLEWLRLSPETRAPLEPRLFSALIAKDPGMEVWLGVQAFVEKKKMNFPALAPLEGNILKLRDWMKGVPSGVPEHSEAIAAKILETINKGSWAEQRLLGYALAIPGVMQVPNFPVHYKTNFEMGERIYTISNQTAGKKVEPELMQQMIEMGFRRWVPSELTRSGLDLLKFYLERFCKDQSATSRRAFLTILANIDRDRFFALLADPGPYQDLFKDPKISLSVFKGLTRDIPRPGAMYATTHEQLEKGLLDFGKILKNSSALTPELEVLMEAHFDQPWQFLRYSPQMALGNNFQDDMRKIAKTLQAFLDQFSPDAMPGLRRKLREKLQLIEDGLKQRGMIRNCETLFGLIQ